MIEQQNRDSMGQAGLRTTAPRRAIYDCLFANRRPQHFTAEDVHVQTAHAGAQISLATVYNTLHSFTRAGLLRKVEVDSSRVWFDTNIQEHHHIFDEDTGQLTDIPAVDLQDMPLPKLQAGKQIERIDLVIRVRNKAN